MNVTKVKSNKSHWKTERNIFPPCETANIFLTTWRRQILDLRSFLDAQRQRGKFYFFWKVLKFFHFPTTERKCEVGFSAEYL